MNFLLMKWIIDEIKSGKPIMYYNIETTGEEEKKRFLNTFGKNEKMDYTKCMKRRKYPLWLLKLLYSRFINPMFYEKRVVSKNWKKLYIDLDGDVLLAIRRFSKQIDKIGINVIIDNGYFIIIEKGAFMSDMFTKERSKQILEIDPEELKKENDFVVQHPVNILKNHDNIKGVITKIISDQKH